MRSGSRPIRTTILVGGLGALLWLVVDQFPGWHWIRPWVRFGLIWLGTACYALLLVRWSRRGLAAVIFPLAVLGLWGGALPPARSGVVLALAILSWVRSGLCFPGPPGRVVVREALICGGGGILVQVLTTHGAVSGALGIWLFFLVQALFFVFLDTGRVAFAAAEDPFERARQRAESLLQRY